VSQFNVLSGTEGTSPESAHATLAASRQDLIAQLAAVRAAGSFPHVLSRSVDRYFCETISESPVAKILRQHGDLFALVAVGGYGRGELCLHSDIDIVLLFRKRIPFDCEALVKELLFPLWDMGLDLGYSAHTVSECFAMAGRDFVTMTSLLDARWVGGDRTLVYELTKRLDRKIVRRRAASFQRWLAVQDRERRERFGDSSYLLESHIKEGLGGLRDYHYLRWLSRILYGVCDDSVPREVLSSDEHRELQEHLSLLLLVRNYLHFLSRRRNDRLSFEYQETLATRLGIRARAGYLPVEELLTGVHAAMGSVKSITRSFVNVHLITGTTRCHSSKVAESAKEFVLARGEMSFIPGHDIEARPSSVMSIFEQSARTGYPLSLEARRLVGEQLGMIAGNLRVSRDAAASFLRIVSECPFSVRVLSDMLELGVLGVFLPEFAEVEHKVEFDAYHIYPVGMHSVETVRYVRQVQKENDLLLHDSFFEISHPERLMLAGFLHDIGKTGKDHAARGAEIAKRIVMRLGLSAQAGEDIFFLVRHHLLLVETATRRDLNDEKVVVQCARIIGTVERLKLLYLLTWADSQATGPKAWNDWIAHLVKELFFKVLHILAHGELATPDASRRVIEIKNEIRRHSTNENASVEWETWFEMMPPRYLLATHPPVIRQHVTMVRQLKEGMIGSDHRCGAGGDDVVFQAVKARDTDGWEITMVAPDRPGLFSRIAGVLALHDISILTADIYTWRDGTAVDVLRTTNPLDALFPGEVWNKVKEDLYDAIRGQLSLEARLREKMVPSCRNSTPPSSRPTRINVDNQSSDFYTIIEVFAEDEIGLLYRITRALTNCGVDIHCAKISTTVDQAVDVFYVRSLEGQMIEDPLRVDELRRTLTKELCVSSTVR